MSTHFIFFNDADEGFFLVYNRDARTISVQGDSGITVSWEFTRNMYFFKSVVCLNDGIFFLNSENDLYFMTEHTAITHLFNIGAFPDGTLFVSGDVCYLLYHNYSRICVVTRDGIGAVTMLGGDYPTYYRGTSRDGGPVFYRVRGASELNLDLLPPGSTITTSMNWVFKGTPAQYILPGPEPEFVVYGRNHASALYSFGWRELHVERVAPSLRLFELYPCVREYAETNPLVEHTLRLLYDLRTQRLFDEGLLEGPS